MDCFGLYIGLMILLVVDAQTIAFLRALDGVQHFSSPGYPNNYTNHLNNKWIITTSSGFNMQLITTDAAIESGLGCSYDAVYVYEGSDTDGHLLGKFCGKQHPIFVSSGDVMAVAFLTDGDLVGRGFRMSYQSGNFKTCGHKKVTSTTTSVELTSPFFPNDYPNDADCTWSIDTADSEYLVLVKVIYLDIEYTDRCSADYLQAYDDREESIYSLGKWCGKRPPPVTHSSGQYMFIRFHSNSNIRRTGFKLEYRSTSRSYYFPDTNYYNSGALPGGISTGLVLVGVVILAIVQRVRKRGRETEQRQIRLASILESSQQRIYTIGGDLRERNFDPSTFAPPPTYDEVMNKEGRPETPPPSYGSLGEMSGAYSNLISPPSEDKSDEEAAGPGLVVQPDMDIPGTNNDHAMAREDH